MDVNRKELSVIKNVLKESPRGMTVTEISRAINLNRHSAAKYLEVLVAAGHVDMRSFGPSKVYFLSQRVPLSAMLSYSSELIVITDNDMIARNMNDRFLEFMGLSRNDVLNKNIENIPGIKSIEPQVLPLAQEAMKGKEQSVESQYDNSRGNFYFIIKYIPTIFEDGEKGVTIIMQDITSMKNAERSLLKARDRLEAIVKERTNKLEKVNESLKTEIEQRTGYEKALRESTEKFRNLVENVNDWIWETDNTGRFVYSSPKIRDMLGYDPKDVIGMRPFDLMEPEKGKKFYYMFVEISRKGDVFSSIESEHLHKDGHTVYTEVSGMPIRNEGGTVIGYTGISHDITERKMVEKELFQRQSEMNTLLDSLPGMAFFKDTKGVYVAVNQYLCDALGLKKTSIIGRTDYEIFNEDFANRIHADDAHIMESGMPLYIEEDLPLSDRVALMATRKTPLKDYSGHITGLVGFALEVTGREQAQKGRRESDGKFQGLVENLNDIVWAMDKNALFTYVSPRIREILGFEPEHYLGKPIMSFMPPEDTPKFMEGFGRIYAYPRPYALENLRMFHRDGHLRSMEVNGMPFYDEKGEFAGFRGVTRDITARKVTEEDLRKSNRALELTASCGQIILRAGDEAGLMDDICRAIVNIGGYSTALAMYAENNESRSIRTVAKAGSNKIYLDTTGITWAAADKGKDPAGDSIRASEICIIRDIAADTRFNTWKDAALKSGFASAMIMPLIADGRTFGALSIYSATKDAFDAREATLLTKLVENISYGVMSLRRD